MASIIVLSLYIHLAYIFLFQGSQPSSLCVHKPWFIPCIRVSIKFMLLKGKATYMSQLSTKLLKLQRTHWKQYRLHVLLLIVCFGMCEWIGCSGTPTSTEELGSTTNLKKDNLDQYVEVHRVKNAVKKNSKQYQCLEIVLCNHQTEHKS